MSKFSFDKIEKSIGGLKFAVIVILVFTFMMIIGTFIESSGGADYANRLIYKRWPFMLTQFLMLLSIFYAAFLRLPPKKRLYGFYTIHSGLILIGCGSFITFYAGIDGSIQLMPNTPARTVILNEDQLYLSYPQENAGGHLSLPYTAFPSDIDFEYQDIKVEEYLPYADQKFSWKDLSKDGEKYNSGRYMVSNPNVSQDFTLSLHPDAIDFDSTLSMGLLNVHYLPDTLVPCLEKGSTSGLIFWDKRNNKCSIPEDWKSDIQRTGQGNRFLVIKDEKLGPLSFFPDFSPWPMNADLKVMKDSPIRLFNQALFQEKPTLFLLGEYASFYTKENGLWTTTKLEKNQPVDLPWMGFELYLLDFYNDKMPVLTPVPAIPKQMSNRLVQGATKAVKVKIKDESYWVTDSKPLNVLVNGRQVKVFLTKKSITLPFEFVLTKFKMDKDPGTNNPASYESFVRLHEESGPSNHHVFMNNPLKTQGFTFYQASYSDLGEGQYSSTFSANVDQGRPIKYLGSLMLVLGAFWHYVLNRKKVKPGKESQNNLLETV
ncbi:MAG: hypothetical protein CME70_02060 [Halobacteriovorax sp.]|nr:hypothetical protein [Halobacteriovorax sp.]|tara:strand:- start:24284 stop:25915 length:1632 start_codon:yes stop_codon:yes gene_type:complete